MPCSSALSLLSRAISKFRINKSYVKAPPTPLLDQISFPSDLKGFNDKGLERIAEELCVETISAVSETGGHLGAGLGVVELTVALDVIFYTPKDKLI